MHATPHCPGLRGYPPVATLLGLALGVGACQDEGDLIPCAEVAAQAIVLGSADDQHESVVGLLDATARLQCTGTVVGGRAGGFFVLTSAHCLTRGIAGAALGSSITGADPRDLPVVGAHGHPGFDVRTGELDAAVLAIAGPVQGVRATALLTPETDTLAVGHPIEFLGYGSTISANTNTARNRVAGVIGELTATRFLYAQDSGGPCQGDSGGPALVRLDERELVAGITSSGDPDCRGAGVSTRVSAVADFVARVIQPPAAPQCGSTRKGTP
jgi:hypothetical protein